MLLFYLLDECYPIGLVEEMYQCVSDYELIVLVWEINVNLIDYEPIFPVEMCVYLIDYEPIVPVEEMYEWCPHWLLHLFSILFQDLYSWLVLLKINAPTHSFICNNVDHLTSLKIIKFCFWLSKVNSLFNITHAYKLRRNCHLKISNKPYFQFCLSTLIFKFLNHNNCIL